MQFGQLKTFFTEHVLLGLVLTNHKQFKILIDQQKVSLNSAILFLQVDVQWDKKQLDVEKELAFEKVTIFLMNISS